MRSTRFRSRPPRSSTTLFAPVGTSLHTCSALGLHSRPRKTGPVPRNMFRLCPRARGNLLRGAGPRPPRGGGAVLTCTPTHPFNVRGGGRKRSSLSVLSRTSFFARVVCVARSLRARCTPWGVFSHSNTHTQIHTTHPSHMALGTDTHRFQ